MKIRKNYFEPDCGVSEEGEVLLSDIMKPDDLVPKTASPIVELLRGRHG